MIFRKLGISKCNNIALEGSFSAESQAFFFDLTYYILLLVPILQDVSRSTRFTCFSFFRNQRNSNFVFNNHNPFQTKRFSTVFTIIFSIQSLYYGYHVLNTSRIHLYVPSKFETFVGCFDLLLYTNVYSVFYNCDKH